jgi:hypothetical protein
MTLIEKIHIEPVNLEDQKITESSELYIEIRDNSLFYSCRFYADEPNNPDDKELGWSNIFNRFKTTASKEKIAGVELSYLPKAKKWGVYIMVVGFASEIKLFFKKEAEANSVYDKLHN